MPKNILVVDDEKTICDLIKIRLTQDGYNVTTALSGKEALGIAEKKDFDLIVLDIMMPEMDGYTVLEEMRKKDSLKNTPVMFLTAKNTDNEVWEGWQSGVDYYVTNPFDTSTLLRAIKICLKEG